MIGNKYKISRFNHVFTGPCIVIGSGPSSKELDEFDLWKNYFSMSINFSQIKYISPIVFYQDLDVYRKLNGMFAKYKMLTIYEKVRNNNVSYINKKNNYTFGIQVSKRAIAGKTSFCIKNDEIRTNMILSGYQGLALANYFGFNPIYAIGFDATDSNYEYAEKHPMTHRTKNSQAIHHLEKSAKFMKQNAVNLNIINCSKSKNVWGIQGNIKDILKHEQNYRSNYNIMENIMKKDFNKKINIIWNIKKEIR
jgi:hypothetical protein